VANAIIPYLITVNKNKQNQTIHIHTIPVLSQLCTTSCAIRYRCA